MLCLFPESFKPGALPSYSTRLNSASSWFFSLSRASIGIPPRTITTSMDFQVCFLRDLQGREGGAFLNTATSLHHGRKDIETSHEEKRE